MTIKNDRHKRMPSFRPGDKIYKLFEHNRALIKGQEEDFIIIIKKRRKASS